MKDMCFSCGYMFSREEKHSCPNCCAYNLIKYKSETQKIKELNLLIREKEEEISILKKKLDDARFERVINMLEISKDEMKEIICSHPMNEGGLPKFMFEESYMAIVDSLDKRLRKFGVRIAYIKD